MTKVVAVGGYKNSGKDTFAHMFPHSIVVEMSSDLKDLLVVLNPVVWGDGVGKEVRLTDLLKESRWDWTPVKRFPEVRRLLQVFGTDVVRTHIGEDTWVDLLHKRVDALVESGKYEYVLVTGVRFANELQAIHTYEDSSSVWVTRGERTSDVASSHISENALKPSDFDTGVDNSGTLEDLQNAVDQITGQWKVSNEQA